MRSIGLVLGILVLEMTAAAQSFVVPMGDVTPSQVTTSSNGRILSIAPNDCAGSVVITKLTGAGVENTLLIWPSDPRDKKSFGRLTLAGLFNDGRVLAIGRDRTADVEGSCLMLVDGSSVRELARNVLAAAVSGNERYVVYVVMDDYSIFRSYRLDLWQNAVQHVGQTSETFWALTGDLTVDHTGRRALVRYRMSGTGDRYQLLTMSDQGGLATFVPTALYTSNVGLTMDGNGERLWKVETDSTRQDSTTLAATIMGIDPANMTVDRTIVVPSFVSGAPTFIAGWHRYLVVDRSGSRFGWTNERGFHFLYDQTQDRLQSLPVERDRTGQMWTFLPGDSLVVTSSHGFYDLRKVSALEQKVAVLGLQPMEIRSLRLSTDLSKVILLPERRVPGFDLRVLSVPDVSQSTSVMTYHTMDSYDDHLYYTRRDSAVVRRDLSTGREEVIGTTRPLPVIFHAAADNGDRFVYTAYERDSSTICVMEGGTWSPIFTKRMRHAEHVQFSRDGKIVVVDTTVWDVDADTMIALPGRLKYPLSPDGRYALYYDAYLSGSTLMRRIVLYDLHTRTDTVFAQGGFVHQENLVKFSRDGSSVLMIKPDGEFARYSLADHKQTHRMKVHLDHAESQRLASLDYIKAHDAFVITPDYHRVEIISPLLTSVPSQWSNTNEPPLINVTQRYCTFAVTSPAVAVQLTDLGGREWSAPFINTGSATQIDLQATPSGLCLIVITTADGIIQRHVVLKME